MNDAVRHTYALAHSCSVCCAKHVKMTPTHDNTMMVKFKMDFFPGWQRNGNIITAAEPLYFLCHRVIGTNASQEESVSVE